MQLIREQIVSQILHQTNKLKKSSSPEFINSRTVIEIRSKSKALRKRLC